MADAAVQFLLEKVSTVLASQLDLISGAENNLQQLNKELDELKSFLKDAAEKPKKLEHLREIERQIREVVYDAEDTIDTCLTHAAKANAKGFVRRHMKKADVSLASQVKSLRDDKVAPIFKKIEQYNNMKIAEGSGAELEETLTTMRKPQTIREDNIVGFKDEEAKLVEYLLEQKSELDIISIIGMPGLGKTTLAWKIFQSEQMKFEFPIRIWLNISEVLNRRGVLLNILKHFTTKDMSGLSDHDLDVAVRKHLQEAGRFLLVMDDVWSVRTWNAIEGVLPKKNMVSKVLVTSRYTDVGNHANRQRKPHNLRFLTPEESWELLQLEVYGNLNDCPKELSGTGYHTALQCKGLPLAIIVIGGILLDLRMKTQNYSKIKESWNKVANNVTQFVTSTENYNISEIVEMSYKILPEHLRDCFVYLGVFPEDYEIPAWTLTRLWIAEGFIIPKVGYSLESTAEENLKELIGRNLVMVDKMTPDDEVKTCRVHDVVRAFCIVKAGIKDQNMYQEIKMLEGVFQPSVADIQKFRRVCIHSDVPEFLSKKPKGPHIRSILSFNKVPIDLIEKLTPIIPDGFDLLRVLDSKSIKFLKFPKGVAKLIHLRYITLCGEDLDSLPKAISELWNLQTIVIETNSSSLNIEANIWKMVQLRHVKTKAAIILVKCDGDGDGENLQTLSRLSPDHCTKAVAEKARNLKTLGIRGNLNKLSSGGKSLKNFIRLEKLKLVNDKSSGPVLSLPQMDFFPVCIRQLTISATSLEWKHLSTLAKISNLMILKLKDKAFVGKLWEASGDGFPQVHYLLIEDTDLAVWTASPNYFQGLKSLVLKNCENLVKIPVDVTEELELLALDNVGKSAIVCGKDIEEKKKQLGGRFKLKIGPGGVQ